MTFERVKKIVGTIARNKKKAGQLTLESNLIDDLEFDSIGFIELMIELEDEFDIELNTEEMSLDVLAQVSVLVNSIEAKLQ
ncbi:phosphopantetheine-binding protein [Vibrio vulnificus]|nr:acyl carrier protein [Vibrio vulnificus]HAS8118914.1 acyl carrier protein [Vibrio vulnificus]